MRTPEGHIHGAVGKPSCLAPHMLVQELQEEIHKVSLLYCNLSLITAISVWQ